MIVRIASEAWICWSFVQPGEWRLWTWILIWISSWNPLKLCDAIRRTTSAPPGQNPGRARPRSAHSPLQSRRSNAPIKPVSQSNLSKIVALLTAIMACIWPIRIAIPLGRSLALRSLGSLRNLGNLAFLDAERHELLPRDVEPHRRLRGGVAGLDVLLFRNGTFFPCHLSRSARSCCSSSDSLEARYSLFASATSRLSSAPRISPRVTSSPRR